MDSRPVRPNHIHVFLIGTKQQQLLPLCVCRLLVLAGLICSCPGWSWTGSWTCLLASSTWTCPLTVWWLCPLCYPGVSSICTLSIWLTTCWKSCQLLPPPRRSSAPGTRLLPIKAYQPLLGRRLDQRVSSRESFKSFQKILQQFKFMTPPIKVLLLYSVFYMWPN